MVERIRGTETRVSETERPFAEVRDRSLVSGTMVTQWSLAAHRCCP